MPTKKKKPAKKAPAKRKRMSGTKGPNLTTAMYAIAGGVAGQMIPKLLTKVMPNLPPVVISGAPLAVGYFLPTLVKGPMGQALGMGMMVAGGVGIVRSVAPNLISGIGGTPMIAGYRNALSAGSRTIASAPMISGVPIEKDFALMSMG